MCIQILVSNRDNYVIKLSQLSFVKWFHVYDKTQGEKN